MYDKSNLISILELNISEVPEEDIVFSNSNISSNPELRLSDLSYIVASFVAVIE